MVATTPAPRIVSWGELLWDLYPEGPRLGGASANLAVHAAQLGCESLLVSRVGADELGTRALALLARAGVDTSAVGVDAQAPTGHVHVELCNGEPRFTIGAPAAWDRISAPSEARARIQASDAFCYGTLAQRSPLVRGELLSLLTELASDARPLLIVDMNLRPPFADAETIVATLERAHVVKLNEGELEALRTLPGLPKRLRSDPLTWLVAGDVRRLVAITRGARGASLYTPGERVDHPGHASSGLDPVGAGDAFTAVLARELTLGTSLPVVLDRACRYAAWVASQPGGQPTAPPALLDEVTGTPSGLELP